VICMFSGQVVFRLVLFSWILLFRLFIPSLSSSFLLPLLFVLLQWFSLLSAIVTRSFRIVTGRQRLPGGKSPVLQQRLLPSASGAHSVVPFRNPLNPWLFHGIVAHCVKESMCSCFILVEGRLNLINVNILQRLLRLSYLIATLLGT
jgi:hypothetical protein